eukprot:1138866-Pelagomonas_calceolata.AAC.10
MQLCVQQGVNACRCRTVLLQSLDSYSGVRGAVGVLNPNTTTKSCGHSLSFLTIDGCMAASVHAHGSCMSV